MFDELVTTILETKSYATPDVVYVPIKLSLRFCLFSAELKSGFQFSHTINNKLDQNSDA